MITRAIDSRPISYTYSLLNSTTYVITQKDKYLEYPFIYLKVYRELNIAVVIDTGCGPKSCADEDAPLSDIKEFIESLLPRHRVAGDRCSEEVGTCNYEYIVVCSHCHFDHILGIESFAKSGAKIVASGHDKDFLSEENLSKNSLCAAFGMETPKYTISLFAGDGERLEHKGHSLGLRVLHTPGHTPDSLAVYDEVERWLLIGDTCYHRICHLPWGETQDAPIIFPLQGDWNDYSATLEKLVAFIGEEESMADALSAAKREDIDALNRWRVRLACGHTTENALAAEFLTNAFDFFCKVVAGAVPVVAKLPGDKVAPGGSLGDEMFLFWQQAGNPKFSMVAPEKFQDSFRSRR